MVLLGVAELEGEDLELDDGSVEVDDDWGEEEGHTA